MSAYLVHYKGSLEDIQVAKYAEKASADAASFDVKEPRSAYVIETDGDMIKLQLSGPQLVKLFNGLGKLIGADDNKEIGKFTDLNTARQRVMLRLIDLGKKLPETEAPKSEADWKAKEREGAIRAASEMYLGAADEFTRKEAERKLQRLGVPVPSKQEVESHTMVAKTTKKKAAKKSKKANGTGRAPSVLTYDLPKNLTPPADASSGTYIRSLIMLGKSTEDILELVHKHFKGSTAKSSDVSWNRAKLRDANKKVPDARAAAKE